jgi:hypothetical protein
MTVLPLRSPESICEEVIERFYSPQQLGLTEFVSALSEDQRVSAAVFCYGRVHLRDIALVIAATCDRAALIEVAGKIMGDILFTQSRKSSTPVQRRWASRKPTVTLASVASAVALDRVARTTIADPEDGEAETPEADEQSAANDPPK